MPAGGRVRRADRVRAKRHERLAAALAKIERAECTSAPETVTLVATLHGLTIATPEIRLTRGLTIATPQALRWAPEQALIGIDGGDTSGAPNHLLVALTCEEESEDGAGRCSKSCCGRCGCSATGA